MSKSRDPGREDFRADDGPPSTPDERESDEPGYDPGPDQEDKPDDPEALQHQLDELYGRLDEVQWQHVELENRAAVIQDQIDDLEARLEQLEDA